MPTYLTPGTHFGRYRIEARVASGGMGVVYRATDMELDRPVALKLIAPEWAQDEALRERFKHESRLVAALDHPNVIPVYDAGERDGVLYIAMRLVDGTDLRGLIDDRGALNPQLAARITSRIASALDAAHAAGLVHRDVKPANVLLTGGPGEEHPYLTDFGLAKRLDGDSGLTHSGQWLGTVDYVAPEQLTGQPVDHRTDVYALAVMLFEELSGEVPFRGDSGPAKMTAKLHEPPPPLSERAPWLPAGLDGVIQRGMAMAPADRYQSAGDLGRALLALVGESSAAVPQPTVVPSSGSAHYATPPAAVSAPAPAPQTPAPPRRSLSPRSALIAAAAIVVATLGVLGLTGVFSGNDDDPSGASPTTGSPAPPPPAAGGAVSTADAEAVVKRFAERYGAEDVDGLMKTLTDDPSFDFNALGAQTTKEGAAELRKEFSGQFDATSDYQLTITGSDAKSDVTIVDGTYSQVVVAGAATEGSVSFEVVESDGTPLIRKISSRVG